MPVKLAKAQTREEALPGTYLNGSFSNLRAVSRKLLTRGFLVGFGPQQTDTSEGEFVTQSQHSRYHLEAETDACPSP